MCIRDRYNGEEHVALKYGDLDSENVLVRVHSECLTGDAFHSIKCDCGKQLNSAMEAISKNGSGLVIYLRQEGRLSLIHILIYVAKNIIIKVI